MPESPAPYLLKVWRNLVVVVMLLVGLLIAVSLLGWLSQGARSAVSMRWNRLVVRGLGVRLAVSGQTNLPDRPVLFVCNHISWLDIPVIASVRPMRFVSKDDVRDWPVMGWLAARVGTLFLNRSNGRAAHRMAATLGEVLRGGDRIVIFPEGTTTDGRNVLPFKPMLLQSVIDAGGCVVPLSLHYSDHTAAVTTATAFIGEMTFVDTLRNIVAVRGLTAEVCFHPPIDSVGMERNELAALSEAVVAQAVAARIAA
ncbi:MAG: 1-acyl-sn-glycerol-3-phosphate acyltransferase [Betaproteobacteria bacterium]|jgi:1-acyl-sn-glycerol-3-phosphate acyltransferase|nr:1-acyl-sn-glycerol-3-phosphate acyltransferase [Betaproteobacteria bacterium]NBR98072.1 1-acyl-sn-glycerol-3-phosphate acyltransferase [Betaproteobacteria bacterium]NBS92512.1 1-acyl-sn-glycerol-3-phosphate acyltransferase [Betaproteobacteria bacterium]NBT05978.1 1-acyl-sn-glycerol-3-phosphate acyltransferase [Betaproteobacteria bacterium]NBY52824.1 1-acyl-sn-glycerol-3-phosphate acyltransferase [Betaproteobacteria bacterium]